MDGLRTCVLIVVLLLIGLLQPVFGQVSVHDGTGTDANASSMLDVQSDDSGILIPRMTQSDRNAISSPATSLLIYQTDNTPGYYYNSGTPGAPVWERIALTSGTLSGSGAANKVAYWTGASTLGQNTNFHWDNSNGRLGIGTASPWQRLDVVGITYLRSASSASVDAEQLRLGRADSDIRYHSIHTYHSGGANSNYMQFKVHDGGGSPYLGQTTVMTLLGDGNVGIGIPTPSQKLHVVGSARISTLADASGAVVTSNASGDLSKVSLTGDANDVLAGNGTFVDASTLSVTGDNLGNHTATTNINVNDRELQNVRAVQGIDWDDNTGGTDNKYRLLFRDGAHMFYDGGVVVGNYGDGTWGDLASGTLIVEGNVGVGATSPSAQLHTTGTVRLANYTNGMVAVDGSGNLLTRSLAASGTGVTMTNGTGVSGNPTISLDYGNSSTGNPYPQGNFGQFQAHGTTGDFNATPGYWGWNYVQGNTNAPNTTSSQWYRGVFSLGNAYPARGSGGYSLELAYPRYSHASAGVWMRTIENGAIGGWTRIDANGIGVSGTTNYMAKFTSGTAVGNSQVYDDGSGVGVGTTSPGEKLHVEGNIRVGSPYGLNSTSDNLRFMYGVRADDTSYEWLGFYSGTTRQGIILYDGSWSGANSSTDEFSITAENGNMLTLNTNGDHIGLMPDGSGKVGVGTLSPTSMLTVNGGIGRTAHNNGHLEGSYNSVGANSYNSNPIYTIGTSYNPNADDLSNMYGIGYTHTNASFITDPGPNSWGMYVASDGDARVWFAASSGGHSYFNTGGNLGINTATPTYHLHVNGRIGTNGINEVSDARLKKDITSLTDALNRVMAMRGVSYNWRIDEFPEKDFDGGLQYGLIAQELEKVVPELVHTDAEGWKSIEYGHIVPLLIEAMKEQQQLISKQGEEIEGLQAQNLKQEERLRILESQFSGLGIGYNLGQADNAGKKSEISVMTDDMSKKLSKYYRDESYK